MRGLAPRTSEASSFQDIHISFWLNFIYVNVLFVIHIPASNAHENMLKCLNVKMNSVEVLCVILLILFNPKTNTDETPVELVFRPSKIQHYRTSLLKRKL